MAGHLTHLNRIVFQVDSQQWGVGGQLGHLGQIKMTFPVSNIRYFFTSLKSSTLLLFAQNSSKLVMCSRPKNPTDDIDIYFSILARRWSPERSAILLLAISMVCRLLLSKPLRIGHHQWNWIKFTSLQNEYFRSILFLLYGCETIVCHI